jgi:5-deoxy-glucuronate isomerase
VSKLVVHSHAPASDGCRVRVTPAEAGWRYVGFEVLQLGPVVRSDAAHETCVVVLSGSVRLAAGDRDWPTVGRASVFDGPPVALYVPPGTEWRAEGDGEIAVCTAPAERGAEARLLDTPRHESRGTGSETREIAHILMEDEPAEALLVTEVVTPAGHWSSFPPHKHDRDDPPRETYLEETYYHRLRPANGFAFQRVYTDDGALDEAIAVRDGDVVLVPRGYHPVAAGARHDLYYLNVMAGPVRAWHIAADPAFG